MYDQKHSPFTLDRYLVGIWLAYTRSTYTWCNVQLVGRTLESGGALSKLKAGSLAKGATRQKSTEHYSSRQKSATAKAPTVLHKT